MKQRYNHYRQFNRKVIVCGKILEVYEYQNPVVKGLEKKHVGRANAPFTTEEQKQENRAKTANRARSYVRRMANANPQLNKFLTLTFAENLTDIEKARYELDKFVKRVKTRHNGFEYIVVPEFQARGAIHFHMLCNLPYVDVNRLAELWGNGFIKINRIDNVDNVGAYITKYMTKDGIDERLSEKKCYSMSKTLKKPVEITDEDRINEVMETLEGIKRVYNSEFESEYYGKISYTQVVLSAPVQLPNVWQRVKRKLQLILLHPDTPTPLFRFIAPDQG